MVSYQPIGPATFNVGRILLSYSITTMIGMYGEPELQKIVDATRGRLITNGKACHRKTNGPMFTAFDDSRSGPSHGAIVSNSPHWTRTRRHSGAT